MYGREDRRGAYYNEDYYGDEGGGASGFNEHYYEEVTQDTSMSSSHRSV